MERLKKRIAENFRPFLEMLHNFRVEHGHSPWGVVVGIKTSDDNPEETVVVYAGGKRLIFRGKEELLLEFLYIPTSQIKDQNISVGDVIEIGGDWMGISDGTVKRIGTYVEVQETMNINMAEYLGFDPGEAHWRFLSSNEIINLQKGG